MFRKQTFEFDFDRKKQMHGRLPLASILLLSCQSVALIAIRHQLTPGGQFDMFRFG